MKKYSDTKIAIWLAIAILRYNKYHSSLDNKNDLTIDDFYFNKDEITDIAQQICTNSINESDIDKYLSIDEEIPKELLLDDEVDTNLGKKKISDMIDFINDVFNKNIINKINIKEGIIFLLIGLIAIIMGAYFIHKHNFSLEELNVVLKKGIKEIYSMDLEANNWNNFLNQIVYFSLSLFMVFIGIIFTMVSFKSFFPNHKNSIEYISFITLALPIIIFSGIVLGGIFLGGYIVIFIINSSMLIYVAFLLSYITNSNYILNISNILEFITKLVCDFFSVSTLKSEITIIPNLQNDIIIYQTIIYYIILFTYSIKRLNEFMYKTMFSIISFITKTNIEGKFYEFPLKINRLFNFNNLRIIVYSLAFIVFIFNSSKKINTSSIDFNDVFTAFIIIDVIIYTLLYGILSKIENIHSELDIYFIKHYNILKEIYEKLNNMDYQEYKDMYFKIPTKKIEFDYLDKIFIYFNKGFRLKYFAYQKIDMNLNRKYNSIKTLKRSIEISMNLIIKKEYNWIKFKIDKVKYVMENNLLLILSNKKTLDHISNVYIKKSKKIELKIEKLNLIDSIIIKVFKNKFKSNESMQEYSIYLNRMENFRGKRFYKDKNELLNICRKCFDSIKYSID